MRSLVMAPLVAFAVAALLTPLAARLAWRLGAIDRPGPRKVHGRPIPRLGGLAIAAGFLATVAALWLGSSSVRFLMHGDAERLLAVLAGGLAMLLLGLADDCRGLPRRTKLLVELVVAAGVVSWGVSTETFPVPGLGMWRLEWLAGPVSVLWLVGITNAVNLCDGLDGQAAGVGLIAAVVIGVLAVFAGQQLAAAISLALAGALAGFLLYNRHPAVTFMGDCGSLFLGFTLAGLGLIGAAKASTTVGLMVPILALGVPIFDTLIAMLRRFLLRRSIFSADRLHIHHQLLRRGLNHRRAVQIVYGASLVGAVMALGVMFSRGQQAGVLFVVGLGLTLWVFRWSGAISLRGAWRLMRERLADVWTARPHRFDLDAFRVALEEARDLEASWKVLCQAADALGATRLALYGADDAVAWAHWQAEEPATLTLAGRARPLHVSVPLGGGACPGRRLEMDMPTETAGVAEAWQACGLLARLAAEIPAPHLLQAEREWRDESARWARSRCAG